MERCQMDHDNTGCQAPPERTMLCINNCGFFGSAATMNMCSKCHKDTLLKQERAKLASALNASTSNTANEAVAAAPLGVQVAPVEPKPILFQPSCESGETAEPKPKKGPSRCTTCNKRVGLTGFKCRCGHLFCGSHRYADKHDCRFNYRVAAQEAIAKANPIVKAEKLDKI